MVQHGVHICERGFSQELEPTQAKITGLGRIHQTKLNVKAVVLEMGNNVFHM